MGAHAMGGLFVLLSKDPSIKKGILKFSEKTEGSHVQYRGAVNRKDDEFTAADFI
jgi:hypothetical protein